MERPSVSGAAISYAKPVPRGLGSLAAGRRDSADQNTWLEGEHRDALQFIEFGHLADVIVQNWEDFEDLVRTLHWLKQRMDELEHARNYVAHYRLLLPGEFRRIEGYIGDWLRQVGV